MNVTLAVIALATFAAAAGLTRVILRLALARGLLDVPNARSSHAQPTPRGGGAAIVAATLCAAIAALAAGQVDAPLVIAFAGGGLAVAIVGFVDDHRQVAASARLTIHVLAAAWAMYWLGGLPALRIGDQLYDFGIAGYVLGCVGIVWALNLFNFMDGIDGIAASEVAFIGMAAVLIVLRFGPAAPGIAALALPLATAAAGFGLWNWPPARIFMGDVGSGFLGFAVAVLALAHARTNPSALFIWAILGAVFIADSGVTLARRFLRRERLHEAHRTHAYQVLSRRWSGHRPVTLAVIAFNLLWLLPCALLAAWAPRHSAAIAACAYIPTLLVVIAAGAGRRAQ